MFDAIFHLYPCIHLKSSWSISSWQKKNWAYLYFCFVAGQSPPFVLVDLFATKTTIRRSHYCSYVVITQSLLARNMFHCEASNNTPNWQGAQERVMHVSDAGDAALIARLLHCCHCCDCAAPYTTMTVTGLYDIPSIMFPLGNWIGLPFNYPSATGHPSWWIAVRLGHCHDICSSFKSAKSA